MKKDWLPYKSNWRNCVPGDKIISVNDYNCVVAISYVYAGDFVEWTVIENNGKYLIAKNNGCRMVFCDDFMDDNGVHTIPRTFGFPIGMTLKHYIQKRQDPFLTRIFKSIRKVLRLLLSIFSIKNYCSHLFKANEMQPRDDNGNVKWECCKCKKMFICENGLAILEHGTCDGNWGLPNKYFNEI